MSEQNEGPLGFCVGIIAAGLLSILALAALEDIILKRQCKTDAAIASAGYTIEISATILENCKDK